MWQVRGETVEIPAPGTNKKFPVYGALNYRTNHVSHRNGNGKNSRNFVAFLAQLAQEYRNRTCILVIDNASYHTSAISRNYLAEMQGTFHVVWLPPYSPELNDIERIWKYVKGAAVANHDFGGVADLREAVTSAFSDLNRREASQLSLRYRTPTAKDLVRAA